jgi:hypothetical protein
MKATVCSWIMLFVLKVRQLDGYYAAAAAAT